ncbi:dihydrofolate reductase family protein [Amycolatopsis sp. NPDC021455]|uniref:dihydrofolate reductase family protein n=1 Tax=Amycolatopsis sp. NPDC021455 TaxID=3154901 RepID=UPI0033F63BFC
MGKIVISETVSLDGVFQDPVGAGGFRFAGWFDQLTDADRQAWAKAGFEEAMGAEALLMGRRTYEWLVARGWASRDGDWPDRLRALPKYVVSSTLEDLTWANSTVLEGDVMKLKQQVDGEIVVYGSGRLVQSLIERDIFDELRLIVCPFALGEGERPVERRKPLRLTDSRIIGDSLVSLTYRP